MGKKITFTARHIIEVRHSKKLFSFLDYRGKLLEHVLEKTGFNKIKVDKNGSRIEVVTDKLEETYFFSFENFGFQLEAESDFKSAKIATNKIIQIIEDFPEYKIKDISRIGTKSTIFCNIPSRSEEGIRQLFFNNLFSNKDDFERKSGLSVTDIAHLYLDAEQDGIKTHITTGPSNLVEIIEKYFSKIDLYLPFNKQSGVFYEIDAYSEKNGDLSLGDISEQINKQFDLIESSFNGYLSIFDKKTK